MRFEDADLPTFASIAEIRLSDLTPREKMITIKISRWTAAMMVDQEQAEQRLLERIANLDSSMDDGPLSHLINDAKAILQARIAS